MLYISIETGPGISTVNKFQCFILTKVSGKNIIMIILENMYVKITGRWFIDFVIKKEKTIVIYRLLAIYRNVFYSNLVTRESQKNVPVWSV